MNRATRAINKAGKLASALRGSAFVAPPGLGENLSWVLHEHSESPVVRKTIAEIERYSSRISRLDSLPVVNRSEEIPEVDMWLCPSIGAVASLNSIAATQKRPPQFHLVDSSTDGVIQHVSFFRGPARLAIPGDQPCQVLVIANPLRPGESDTEIVWEGPFTWPDDKAMTLGAIESIVLRYANQWMPAVPLFDGPAEGILPPGEIVSADSIA